MKKKEFMKIRIINESKNQSPKYANMGDAGFDLRANLNEDIIISPGERILISTGLFFEIPLGFEGQVRSRSGMALKNGLVVLNSPGTIDSSYRGECKVILINQSKEPQTVRNSDRIAQMVIAKHETVEFEQVLFLNSTERNAGGFGSTGKK